MSDNIIRKSSEKIISFITSLVKFDPYRGLVITVRRYLSEYLTRQLNSDFFLHLNQDFCGPCKIFADFNTKVVE